MIRGRIGVVLAMTAAGAFAGGCGPQVECQIDTRVVRQTDKVIEIEWTLRNNSGDPIWIPTKWKPKVNYMGEPPEMPLAFVAWPDSLIFVAAQVCEDGPDRDKVTENLRRQLYRPEKERVGRPESMPGGPAPGAPTSRSAESGQGGVFERQFFQTEDEPLGPGQSHTYRVVLPLPYRVQDMFKNPFAAREKSDLNEAGWIFDGREDVEETLPARATRVWLGVCYYLGDPDVDEGSGKREQALCRMLITKSLKEGQQFRWENTGFGAILDVTIRYATSEPLEIAVPLKVERWQYLGPDMPADPNSDSPADDADESPGTHEKDASKEMKESKGP